MNSQEIIKLLKQKHEQDVFVEEAVCGPGGKRMDAWAMRKTWQEGSDVGYEIKVSRGDFLHDNKWEDYLKYCSRFYFVCPWGLIDKSEVGDQVGLMYATKTGSRLLTKKKAPLLDVDPKYRVVLMKAILMSRVNIVDSTFGRSAVSPEQYWKKWLEDKERKWLLGRSVSMKLQRQVREKINEVEAKNRELETENKTLTEVKEFLKRNDIPVGSYVSVATLEKTLKRDLSDLRNNLHRGRSQIDRVIKALDEEIQQ